MNIKSIILKNKLLYEFYFFISGKKINRNKIDKKIRKIKKIKQRKHIDKLIISLTSYGERLNDLKYTLYSLVSQTIVPEKIIVWLDFNDKIPECLEIFKDLNVEFEYCENYRSYKKLIPTMKKYKGYSIVTADDDIFYSKNWLKKLWECHLQYPDEIIAHIAHNVKFKNNNMIEPYNNWDHCIKKNHGKLFLTGVGGILYPPVKYYVDFTNDKLFMSLSPKADDVWFFFMEQLNHQKLRIVDKPIIHLKYVNIYKEYGLDGNQSLQAENVGQNLNDKQIENIMQYYKISGEELK